MKPGDRALVVGLSEMPEYNGTVCQVMSWFEEGFFAGMRTGQIVYGFMAVVEMHDGRRGRCPRNNLIRIPPDDEAKQKFNEVKKPRKVWPE